jgi:hypothetical protein
MLDRSWSGSVTLAAALCVVLGGDGVLDGVLGCVLGDGFGSAQAFDETKYPDLKGQWHRTGAPRWADPSKAPLTAEYRAIFEANLRDQATGGQGTDPTFTCLPPGMPRVMNVYEPMEIVVTPHTTHLLMQHIHDSRRIFTDGREWPQEVEPTFAGYSIGTWVDRDGDGRYDELVVETRNMKGPRSYDGTGLPLHQDNRTVIKERISLDQSNANSLYDEITVIDNALTRPWTITKKYLREAKKDPVWRENVCAEGNQHVVIGKENYFMSADGYLMPAKKDQAPPDLRYFDKAGK